MKIYRNFPVDFEPRRFADLCGQDELVEVIRRWFIDQRIPPFILLSGPMGIGKSLLAKLLVKSAICLNRKKGEHEACGVCETCQRPIIGTFYQAIGSRVDADLFRDTLCSARSGGHDLFEGSSRRWFPVWIDELHELPKQAVRDLRQELSQRWANSFLVATTHAPEDLDEPLRDRFVEYRILAPTKSEQKTWMLRVCKTAGLPVTDPGAFGIIADHTHHQFRKSLKVLQRIYDLAQAVDEKSVRRAIESCGYAEPSRKK